MRFIESQRPAIWCLPGPDDITASVWCVVRSFEMSMCDADESSQIAVHHRPVDRECHQVPQPNVCPEQPRRRVCGLPICPRARAFFEPWLESRVIDQFRKPEQHRGERARELLGERKAATLPYDVDHSLAHEHIKMLADTSRPPIRKPSLESNLIQGTTGLRKSEHDPKRRLKPMTERHLRMHEPSLTNSLRRYHWNTAQVRQDNANFRDARMPRIQRQDIRRTICSYATQADFHETPIGCARRSRYSGSSASRDFQEQPLKQFGAEENRLRPDVSGGQA